MGNSTLLKAILAIFFFPIIPAFRSGQPPASEASPGNPIAHCTTKLFRSGHYSFPEGNLQGFTAHYELQENALNVSLGRERIGNCGEESVFVVVGKRDRESSKTPCAKHLPT